MYRPRILATVTGWLLTPPGPIAPIKPLVLPTPIDQAGLAYRAERQSTIAHLTVMARRFASSDEARRAHEALRGNAGTLACAFDLAIHARSELPLPIPGSAIEADLVRWTTISRSGSLAWVAAVIRHEMVVWEITANGAEADTLTQAVLHLALHAATTVPHGTLGDLLPSPDALPTPMYLDAVFARHDPGAIAA